MFCQAPRAARRLMAFAQSPFAIDSRPCSQRRRDHTLRRVRRHPPPPSIAWSNADMADDRTNPRSMPEQLPPPATLLTMPGYVARRLHHAYAAAWQRHVDPLLTGPQFAVLTAVDAYPGVEQGSLARAVALDRSTMASIVRRLEDRKLIIRETPATTAASVCCISPTPAPARFARIETKPGLLMPCSCGTSPHPMRPPCSKHSTALPNTGRPSSKTDWLAGARDAAAENPCAAA